MIISLVKAEKFSRIKEPEERKSGKRKTLSFRVISVSEGPQNDLPLKKNGSRNAIGLCYIWSALYRVLKLVCQWPEQDDKLAD